IKFLQEELQKILHQLSKSRAEGWKSNQGNYEKTLSIHEPTKFIEEEVIIMRQGGKQERKIIRRPLDEDENIEEGEQLLEDLGEGYYVVSRKIVDNDLSLTSSKWKKNNDGNYEQSLGVEPSQYITEEVLQFNNETGMMERKLVRKPYFGGKVQEGDSLNEVDKNGNKVLSRKIESNLQPKESKQQWQNVGKQEEIILNSEEPEQFIEEEIIQINPKTGKLERKIVRKPLNNEEIDNLQIGQNLEEDLGNGKQVISRKIVQNDQSNQALKQQGWIKNNDGNMEIKFQPEPVKYVEEEILIQGEDGVVQRKLVRRPFLPQDNKLQTGAVIEQDLNGNKVVSRKIVSNNKPVDSTWVQLNNGQLEKIVSQEEPEAYIEEEIIIINPKTGKQERKLVRRPYENDEEIGDQLNESIGNNQKVVARRIVQNDSSLNEWKKNQKTGQLEKVIVQNEPAKYIEEEVLVMNEETGKMERKLVRKQYQPENDSYGNKILARRIVENTSSTQQVEKEGWKSNQGNYEKTLSIHEPTKFIEEEVIIMRQGGKQERKIIRRPLDEDENIEDGEQLLEDLGEDCLIMIYLLLLLSGRRIMMGIMNNHWELNHLNIQQKKSYTFNNETGMMERKLVRKPYLGGKVQEGDSLNEVDKNGNKVLSRKIESNLQPKASKQQWQNVGKQEEIILNSEEPEQFIEEEIIQINPKTGKLERKIVRKPLNNEEIDNLQIGQNLEEDLGNGKQVISRKIVQNDQSNQALKQQGWIKNNEGNMEIKFQPEPVKYVEEEILIQGEDGVIQRKLIRRPFLPQDNKLQTGAVIEQDLNGNKVVSRKIVSNNKPVDSTWKIVSQEEPEAYIEEEIIIINPKTQKQERKLIRRPLTQSEVGVNWRKCFNELGDGTRKVVARRIVSNEQSSWILN
ncbi:unnamed protein product, partial (macronuclear) [Paramecium tetraurelia]